MDNITLSSVGVDYFEMVRERLSNYKVIRYTEAKDLEDILIELIKKNEDLEIQLGYLEARMTVQEEEA
jgi:hypothetical protein